MEEQKIKELAEKWTNWANEGGRRSDTVSAIEMAIREALKITSNTVLAECSHLWTKSDTSANTDWWCSRCGKVTNAI